MTCQLELRKTSIRVSEKASHVLTQTLFWRAIVKAMRLRVQVPIIHSTTKPVFQR